MQLRELKRITGPCVLAAILCLLLVAGCGGGDSSNAAAEGSGSSESGIPDSPPPVEVPEGLPPKKLVVKELFKGTGTMAKKGDEVALHYNCIVWENGSEYANSWRYASVPVFKLGERIRLLRGLDSVVPGMREGGGREVIIPHNLIYYQGVEHPPVGRLGALICKTYLVDVLSKKRRG